MLVAGEGRRPGVEHLDEPAKQAGICARFTRDVIGNVRGALARWSEFAGSRCLSGIA